MMKTMVTGTLGVALLAAIAVAVPPDIQPIPDWELDEDTFLSVDITVVDPDSPELVFWVEVEDAHVQASFDQENMQVHVNPQVNWNGATRVTVGVDDADGGRTVDTEQFMVTVLPVNDCPVQLNSTPQPPTQTPEDTCLFISFSQLRARYADPDWAWEGDTLIFQNPVYSVGTVTEINGGWSLCAPAHFYGAGQLSYQATDETCVLNSIHNVTVSAVNDCPMQDAPWAVQAGTEDESLVVPDLLNGWSDVDNPTLTFHAISGGTAGFTAGWNAAAGSLTLVPPQDFNGEAQLLLSISDGACQTTAWMSLQLAPVNDPPQILPPAMNVEMQEDEALLLTLPISDVDGPGLVVTVVSDAPELTAVWLSGTQELSLECAPNWNGSAVVTVTACDDYDPEACSVLEIPVTVQPVNDDPVIQPLPDAELAEDTQLELAVDIVDIDSQDLLVSVSCSQEGLLATWQDEAQSLLLAPVADWNGAAEIEVRVDDQDGRSVALVSFQALVTPVNDAPVLPGLTEVALDEDGLLLVDYPVLDVDGPTLTLTVSSNAPQLAATWNAQTSQLRLQPAADWFGTAELSLEACDGHASEACVQAVLAVTVHAINDAPVLPVIAPQTTDEDTDLLVACHVLDVDGPALTVTTASDTEYMVAEWLVATAELSLRPAPDWSGTAHVTVRACDGFDGPEACVETIVTVTVQSVNDAPVLEPVADQELQEDAPAWVPIVLHDLDSEPLLFTVDAERAELVVTWHPDSSRLLLSPSLNWHGTSSVTVTVDDQFGRAMATATFSVTVLPVNDGPEIDIPTTLELLEDEELLVDCTIIDVDGPGLTVTTFADPSAVVAEWLPEMGSLRVTPVANWHGQALLTIRACDGYEGGEACSERQVVVVVGPVNDAPAIAPLADQEMNEDAVLVMDVAIYDLDNEGLEVVVECVAPELTVLWNAEEGQLTLTPAANWHGTTVVTVSVDDGEGRAVAQRSFQILVRAVNDAPHAAPCGSWSCGPVEDAAAFRTLLLGGELRLDVADVDADDLQLTWFVDGVAVAQHVFNTQGDTLTCWSLPAPPEELIVGAIVLHAELGDGTVTVNPGGEDCAWELDFTGLADTAPARFALGPCYPNPFNPSTRVGFSLGQAGPARLTIYDMRGALVARLVDGWQAAGPHETVWQAGSLASGVYLAILEAEGRSLVERLTLIK